jgi:hypothetical protein
MHSDLTLRIVIHADTWHRNLQCLWIFDPICPHAAAMTAIYRCVLKSTTFKMTRLGLVPEFVILYLYQANHNIGVHWYAHRYLDKYYFGCWAVRPMCFPFAAIHLCINNTNVWISNFNLMDRWHDDIYYASGYRRAFPMHADNHCSIPKYIAMRSEGLILQRDCVFQYLVPYGARSAASSKVHW